MANTATKIDWDCASTKRHIQEAKKRKLILIGPGLDRNSRMYEFMECRHQQVIRIVSVRNEDQLCDTCLKDTSIKSDFYSPSGTEKIRLKRYEKWLNNCLKKFFKRFNYDGTEIFYGKYDRNKHTHKTYEIDIYCNLHKQYFSINPNTHLSRVDGGCKKCARDRRKKRHLEEQTKIFLSYFKKERSEKFVLVDQFKGMNIRIRIKCLIHEKIKSILPSSFMNNNEIGCNECTKESNPFFDKKSLIELKSELKGRLPDHVQLIKTVFNEDLRQTEVVFYCEFHGEQQPVSLSYIHRTQSFCKECGKSNIGYPYDRFKKLINKKSDG